jgi:hypothetical protein
MRAETLPRLESYPWVEQITQLLDRKSLGLLVAIAIAWTLWQMPPPARLDEKGMHFLATLGAGVTLWLFEVFDKYITALLLLFSSLVFEIIPTHTALEPIC